MPLSHDEFWAKAKEVLVPASPEVAGATALQDRLGVFLDDQGWRDFNGKLLYDVLTIEVAGWRLDAFGTAGDAATKIAWFTAVLDDLDREINQLSPDGKYYWGGMDFGWQLIPEGWALHGGEWVQPQVDVSQHEREASGEGRGQGQHLTLEDAMTEADLQEWADDAYEFFYDGSALRMTQDWTTFYDSRGTVTGAPAAGTYRTWLKGRGLGHADYDPTDPAEVADSGDMEDDEAFAESMLSRAKKEKDGKDQGKKAPPKATLDPQGYVLISGQQVIVNGCSMYQDSNGHFYAQAADGATYAVMNGGQALDSLTGLTFEHGIARVGAQGLSLHEWAFEWDVIIADPDKYEQEAVAAFIKNLSNFDYPTGRPTQLFAQLDELAGHPAHVSVNAADMRREVRSAIARGRRPAQGFLSGARFHVTIEVYGQDDPRNPRVFDNSGEGWKGDISYLGGLSDKTAIQAGREWLRDNR